jgi:branched-chain amino acid transport system substrate-binding protein
MKFHTSAALAACASVALASNIAAAADIKVGLLLPKSGTYAALGKEIEDGFTLALDEAGMIEDFTIVVEDSEAKPPVGVAKARKLVLEDQVDVMAGIVSSAVLGAVRDFVDGAKVPLIVANAGNNEATGESCSPYITRVSFSNAQVNRPMGEWLAKSGYNKVYTLAPDYAAGHQMIDAFTETYVANGGEIVGSEYTPFGKTQDFGPYLTKAKATAPDAIYVFYAGGEAITFVKQYDSFGMKQDIPLYGSGFLTSPLYVAAEGAAAVGVTTALHYVPTLNTPENRALVESFSAKYGKAPSEFAVQGYDAGRVLAEAVKAGASDRETIKEQLSQVSYSGPRGPLLIDPNTNNIVQNVYVYETVANGDALTQKVIGTFDLVRDPANGCKLN